MPDSEQPDPGDAELSFEEAFAKLEGIVRDMESDRIPLRDLIERYEQGTSLYKVCQERLEEAQGRIETIRRRANGEVTLEPFGEEAPAPSSNEKKSASAGPRTRSPQPADTDDAELF